MARFSGPRAARAGLSRLVALFDRDPGFTSSLAIGKHARRCSIRDQRNARPNPRCGMWSADVNPQSHSCFAEISPRACSVPQSKAPRYLHCTLETSGHVGPVSSDRQKSYLLGLSSFNGVRKRTPGPPMSWPTYTIPTASRARWICDMVLAVPTSWCRAAWILLTVPSPMDARLASSCG